MGDVLNNDIITIGNTESFAFDSTRGSLADERLVGANGNAFNSGLVTIQRVH